MNTYKRLSLLYQSGEIERGIKTIRHSSPHVSVHAILGGFAGHYFYAAHCHMSRNNTKMAQTSFPSDAKIVPSSLTC